MREVRPAVGYVALSSAWVAVHLLLPSAFWQDLSYLVSSLPPGLLLLRAARRLTGSAATLFRTLALACGISALGNVCYLVQAHVLGSAVFIAPSDVCFLLSALTVALALLRAGQSAPGAWTLGGVMDHAVVLLGFGLLFHTLVLAPVLASRPDLLTLTTTLVYPGVDLLVLLLAARLVAGSTRSAAGRALIAYGVVGLAAGGTYAVLGVLGAFSTGDPVDGLFLARNLGLGVVVLLPGITTLVPRPACAAPSTGQNALVLPAGLLGPAALLAQVASGDGLTLAVAAFATGLGWAVLARLALTLRVHRRLLVGHEELRRQLEHRIEHDALTGLANRTLLERHLLQRLLASDTTTRPAPDERLALLYLDLNEFKQVNDDLGHAAGDRLLVQVGQRLKACARSSDLVARLAGDEFAVLVAVPAAGAGKAAGDVVARLREAFAQPFALGGQAREVGASIGVALVEPGDGLERVLHRADSDMYRQKRTGQGRRPPLALV